MRPLILFLCSLLTACTLTVVPPTPTPDPPSFAKAEALYRALALQWVAQEAWLESVRLARADKLEGMDALGAAFFVAALLRGSHDLLQETYPAVLQPDVTIASTQGRALARLFEQAMDGDTLDLDDLHAIDTVGTLRNYTDHLSTLGFSPAQIERMEARLREELQSIVDAD